MPTSGCSWTANKQNQLSEKQLMNSVLSYTNSSVRNLAVFDLNRSSSQYAKSVARLEN